MPTVTELIQDFILSVIGTGIVLAALQVLHIQGF